MQCKVQLASLPAAPPPVKCDSKIEMEQRQHFKGWMPANVTLSLGVTSVIERTTKTHGTHLTWKALIVGLQDFTHDIPAVHVPRCCTSCGISINTSRVA
eukprot:364847-Chlamydomonas_euryale.AAC.3